MEEQEELGLISFVDAGVFCVRQRRLIAKVTTALIALGAFVVLLSKPSYTAVATILPPQQPASSLLAQMGSAAAAGGISASAASLGVKTSTDLYVSLLRSRTVEDAMIDRFALKQEFGVQRSSDARKKLEEHIAVDGSGKDGLIRLSVVDHNAARAQELANGWVEQYQSFMQGLAIGEAAQRRVFFEKRLEKEKDELATAEEALKRMEQTSGTIQIDSQTKVMIESTAGLRAQIAAKEVQVQSIESYAGAGNLDLIAARRELEALRSQLHALAGGGNVGETGLDPHTAPQATMEAVRGVREVKYHEALVQALANQYELARLDESKEGTLFQSIDVAVLPDRPSSPGPIATLIAFAVAGVVGGVLFAFMREALGKMQATEAFAKRMAKLRLAREAGRMHLVDPGVPAAATSQS